MLHSFLEALRSAVRAQGFTQTTLASRIGVSVPTIKRWLRGEGLDLKALERLLAAIGLTFAEVASVADIGQAKGFEYTETQEFFLSRDFVALAVFDHLLHGFSVKTTGRLLKLSAVRVSRILKGLETVRLLDRHPRDRVQLLVRGEPIWLKNGPLQRAFKENAVSGFLAQADRKEGAKVFGVYWLVREDIRKGQLLLDELRDFLRRAESRARLTPEQTQLYACFSAYGSFDWSVLRTEAR